MEVEPTSIPIRTASSRTGSHRLVHLAFDRMGRGKSAPGVVEPFHPVRGVYFVRPDEGLEEILSFTLYRSGNKVGSEHDGRAAVPRIRMRYRTLFRGFRGPAERGPYGGHDRGVRARQKGNPDDLLQVTLHCLVQGDPAREHGRRLELLSAKKGVDDILGQAPAQTIADLLQGESRLLGMHEIGAGKHCAPGGDPGAGVVQAMARRTSSSIPAKPSRRAC